MGKFRDTQGATQDFPVDESIYARATAAGMSVQNYIDQETGTPGAFAQLAVNAGLNLDPRAGNVPTIQQVADGSCMMASPGGTSSTNNTANTRPSVPESAILFPAAVIATIENQLRPDLTTIPGLYEQRIQNRQSIVGQDFRRVVMNFQRPSAARRGRTAQLAKPHNMLLLTTSDRPGTVPTTSLGLEVAEQVVRNNPINVVVLSLQRQMEVQRSLDVDENILSLLNGNEDTPQGAIPASLRVKASDLDAEATGGILTQKAWLGFFRLNSKIRTIDTVITDFAGAYAIEQRKNRPTILQDNNRSGRLDTRENILNPGMPEKVDIIVIDNPDWPAGTIMGFDSRYAIQRVDSLTADYRATATDAIRRAECWRFDHGSVDYRLFDDSFTVMTLE